MLRYESDEEFRVIGNLGSTDRPFVPGSHELLEEVAKLYNSIAELYINLWVLRKSRDDAWEHYDHTWQEVQKRKQAGVGRKGLKKIRMLIDEENKYYQLFLSYRREYISACSRYEEYIDVTLPRDIRDYDWSYRY